MQNLGDKNKKNNLKKGKITSVLCLWAASCDTIEHQAMMSMTRMNLKGKQTENKC